MRRRTLVATSVALVLASAVAANATWSKAGTGSGVAKTRALADVASPAAAKLSATSIRVSWSTPTNPTGTRYKVVRSSGTGSPATICPSLTTSPCDDTSLAAGTYGYTVQTILPSSNWTRTAVSAGSVTLTAPVAGLAWVGLSTTSSNTTPLCTGTIGATYTCKFTKSANSQSATGFIAFVDASGNEVSNSASDTTITISGSNVAPAGDSVIPGGNTRATTAKTVTMQGSQARSVTATFNSWTAVLTIGP